MDDIPREAEPTYVLELRQTIGDLSRKLREYENPVAAKERVEGKRAVRKLQALLGFLNTPNTTDWWFIQQFIRVMDLEMTQQGWREKDGDKRGSDKKI